MSNGRKIFRFLKFVEDFRKFTTYIYESSFNLDTILKTFISLSASFYHFLDNLVWASNVGMIGTNITADINWKSSKNFFSIIKTLFKIINNLITFKDIYYNSWINEDNEIVEENYEKIVNETIKNWSKLRMVSLNILQGLLKLCTSLYSLKFQPISNYLHPIIVSFCGIAYCAISIFKIYIKIQEKQRKILKTYKKSSMENINKIRERNSSQFAFNMNKENNDNESNNHLRRRSVFELSVLERMPNSKLICDESYFENYYIDFNKDYPMVPELVLKANGGILKN
jgi:hypothetical protein